MSSADKSASLEVITLNDSKDDTNQNDSVSNLQAESPKPEIQQPLSPGEILEDSVILLEPEKVLSEQKTNNDHNNIQPIIKVIFRDTSALEKYHKRVETLLKTVVSQGSDKKKVKTSTEDLVLQIFDFNDTCKHSTPPIILKRKRSDDVCDYPGQEQQKNDALFTIDTELKLHDDLDIPMYGKKFNKALQKSNEDNVETKESKGPKMTCFNCLGNHSLRDCSEPRNYAAINKNRKDYNAKRGPTNSRYHLEDDQKFGHFIPGQISSNLRKALGLKDNELPKHIYRMRILGYPPGWLEEARLQHSGLTLFNSDGLAEGGSDEEGEIVFPGDKDKYDVKKIIDFPGFNVLPPSGTRDEFKQYWGSAMQERYSKTAMLSYLSNKKVDDGYKRRKLINYANAKIKTDINSGEMELDEIEDTSVECVPVKDLFIPPLPKEDIPEPPPPPPPLPGTEDSDSQSQEDISIHSNDESTAPSSRGNSPSLFDLECTKKQLLAELDDSSSQSNPDTTKTSVPDSDSSKIEKCKSNQDVNITPKNKTIKEIHLGTPILPSTSPFRRLPTSEKFSKDICDVINFENLPDSTGKYDQMSELLQKVRMKVSELQKE